MPGHHTHREKRMARDIERSEQRRGVKKQRAQRIAWATVNKRRKEKR